MAKPCRCGWDGETGPHPCHSDGYRCRQPAEQRFRITGPAHLAGMQLKFNASETWACDECWSYYQKYVKDEITPEEWLDKAWIRNRTEAPKE